jgi:hypothetical protein
VVGKIAHGVELARLHVGGTRQRGDVKQPNCTVPVGEVQSINHRAARAVVERERDEAVVVVDRLGRHALGVD